ncbi:MAG: glycoside hydrolase family 88 protein [Butyrivibrio sp.]|nr:glycoside hydrolase family 88 protein [Butyrivibrio sp.]
MEAEMADMITKAQIEKTLQILSQSFQNILYEDDDKFMDGMKDKNLAGDDIRKYQHWEWTQGVGLYGMWMLYSETGDESYKKILDKYYERSFETGLPSKNINTTAPMLALSFLAENEHDKTKMDVCREWARCVMEQYPRSEENGMIHRTSDSLNNGELWDDTLYMAVLFLANMGRIEGRDDYIQESLYQYLVHIKYLTDKKTGLFFHGWTFNGRNNFAEGLWGRGNSWLTASIPEIFEIVKDMPEHTARYLKSSLMSQVDALVRYQDPSGMWHTLIDDEDSYLETSATCGFGYGILKSIRLGILPDKYKECALKALSAVMDRIGDDGVVEDVSYGTPMGRDSKDFYKQIPIKPMPYGQAMAMLFLIEAAKVAEYFFK